MKRKSTQNVLIRAVKEGKGKKNGKPLRELEKGIIRDLEDNVNSYTAYRTTLNSFYEEKKRKKLLRICSYFVLAVIVLAIAFAIYRHYTPKTETPAETETTVESVIETTTAEESATGEGTVEESTAVETEDTDTESTSEETADIESAAEETDAAGTESTAADGEAAQAESAAE
ncbi:MAG: hypothetical protein EGP94_14345 [Lachnospiraceae bacterium]|nr:hypothetical protein [Lachnospiraceae bacterium]